MSGMPSSDGSSEIVMPETIDRRRLLVVAGLGLGVLLIVLVRTAWVGDDAFITFRTADNFVHGYGLRWNVDERVQSYTHPLWLGVFTAAYAITREPYFTSLILGMLISLAAAGVIFLRLARTPWHALAAAAALLSSKAFVDFSTSGLENPVSHLLLAVFLWRWWVEPDGARGTFRLSLIAAFCLLNRMDLAVLLGPALLVHVWRSNSLARLRPLLLGSLPFVAWEVFSLVYYGFLFPNTAYAKLNTGIPETVLLHKGVFYAHVAWLSDPVTIAAILISPLAVMPARSRRDWPLVLGAVLFGFYVTWIGGDFMMGRFYTPVLVWSVAILAHSAVPRPAMMGAVAVAMVALGFTVPDEPALLSGYHPPKNDRYLWWLGEVTDERRIYFPYTGLLEQRPGQVPPGLVRPAQHPWAKLGIGSRVNGARVVTSGGIGFIGYFAGSSVHLIDFYALSDPLLARLPSGIEQRIGHFTRRIPEGYQESLASGRNQIADPDLAAYWDRLHLIVSGPIWSVQRFETIAAMLTGRYDHYVRDYVAHSVKARASR